MFWLCVLFSIALILVVLMLTVLGIIFEKIGIPPVTICIGFPVIVLIILAFWIWKR